MEILRIIYYLVGAIFLTVMMIVIVHRSYQKVEQPITNNPPEGTCPCDSCDYLKIKYSQKNSKYWMYSCSERNEGFDLAPDYCKNYKKRKGNI